jgi:hypothetical protein
MGECSHTHCIRFRHTLLLVAAYSTGIDPRSHLRSMSSNPKPLPTCFKTSTILIS